MALAQDKTVTMTVKPKQPTAEGEPLLRCRGLRFPDRPDILAPRLRRALRRSNYERTEADAARSQVTSDDTVLELGGGIGFMSSLMARNCNARHVHVYEPNPDAVAYMRDVHALNEIDNVTVTNAIVGPKKGTATFYQRENLLASSLDKAPAKMDTPIVAEHEIEVLNINTVWKDLRPSVLVCDIEGAEADLFDKATLTGIRLAIIEIHPQWIGASGVRAVFEAMHRNGLTYFPKASMAKVVVFKSDF
ncbi:MAG: FkbM family methyltransferase [Pseudomonadota bacterium]|nr:FkbM family methyltransferase [Pseudomonadota bacterium]